MAWHPDASSSRPVRDRGALPLRLGISFRVPLPTNTDEAEIAVRGDVGTPLVVRDELAKLPRVDLLSDLHCVTTWSGKRGLHWSGFRFRDFHLGDRRNRRLLPLPAATLVVLRSQDGYVKKLCSRISSRFSARRPIGSTRTARHRPWCAAATRGSRPLRLQERQAPSADRASGATHAGPIRRAEVHGSSAGEGRTRGARSRRSSVGHPKDLLPAMIPADRWSSRVALARHERDQRA